jgi:hypothetical protein
MCNVNYLFCHGYECVVFRGLLEISWLGLPLVCAHFFLVVLFVSILTYIAGELLEPSPPKIMATQRGNDFRVVKPVFTVAALKQLHSRFPSSCAQRVVWRLFEAACRVISYV